MTSSVALHKHTWIVGTANGMRFLATLTHCSRMTNSREYTCLYFYPLVMPVREGVHRVWYTAYRRMIAVRWCELPKRIAKKQNSERQPKTSENFNVKYLPKQVINKMYAPDRYHTLTGRKVKYVCHFSAEYGINRPNWSVYLFIYFAFYNYLFHGRLSKLQAIRSRSEASFWVHLQATPQTLDPRISAVSVQPWKRRHRMQCSISPKRLREWLDECFISRIPSQ